ncbi:hypothetical protein [Halobacillus sp. Marseille-Q1614]|uniref:hypothetical protein n=1 Tax=Halobacillus sp. Marseille-Q1614 TaxID=2709134 RepID=UPI00157088D6|nr:hypothetical protein [Halobacillus sp. Marseille-Q1614]
MKTCAYCGTPLKQITKGYFCDFCDMQLKVSQVKENHERVSVRIREFALESYIHKSTPELMKLSTFELLDLLKKARTERGTMYHQNLVFHKVMDISEDRQYEEYEKVSGEAYTYMTRKMFVLENLVYERLGYIPTRITERYLIQYIEKIQKGKRGTMKIRTTKI